MDGRLFDVPGGEPGGAAEGEGRGSRARWSCGGVGVNHHALSDFRVEHGEVLDQPLTQSVAVLMDQGVVELQRVAQDGTRVRASP